jgi:diaminohydroxyphosphoribosylaminopyrimidine deaminase/5-amino-6-(5-phosphoribosylamino)uracil reductase
LPTLKFVQELRNRHDAILVGINTVLIDDPSLTCRLEGGRDPLRVILDSHLRIPLTAKALKDDNVVIAATRNHDEEKAKALGQKGIAVIETDGSQVNLKQLLTELGKRNVCSILVEGGAKVATSFVKEKLVDKAVFITAPKAFASGVDLVDSIDLQLKDAKVTVSGDNAIFEGVPA